jgi:hypothetical protein
MTPEIVPDVPLHTARRVHFQDQVWSSGSYGIVRFQ